MVNFCACLFSIRKAAGSAFTSYATNHAGLGIWDTTTDDKFSIEFVSNNYVGALFPDLSVQGEIHWQNQASIVIRWPVNDTEWLTSRLITTTIGSAYSQLIDYLQDHRDEFQSYQPITGLFVNETRLAKSTTSLTNNEIYGLGKVVVASRDSYWFVDNLIYQLGSYGCDLDTFLQVYASSSNYLTKSLAAPTVVNWNSLSSPPTEVYEWYSSLYTCYNEVYDATVSNGGGAQYFLQAVQACYANSSSAYLFKTNTSVYNLSLLDPSVSATYGTLLLAQYVYHLPPDDDGDNEKLTALDYIMIALAAIAVIGGLGYFLYKFFGKKKRRHISFEGERVATNIAGPLAELDHEERAYYQ